MPPPALKESCKRSIVGCYRKFGSGRTFDFEGKKYNYFYHPYNLAWRNERSIEVPIVLERLLGRGGCSVLEVGNVLSHYMDVEHDVLDKYEAGPGVINADAAEFDPGREYDLIISISTLEHIGIDEEPSGPGKAVAAAEHLKGLLAPGGTMIATVPVGANAELDRALLSARGPFESKSALRRRRMTNSWEQVEPPAVAACGYSRAGFRARAVLVVETRRGQGPADG